MKKILLAAITIITLASCSGGTGEDAASDAGIHHLVFLSLRNDLRPSEINDARDFLMELKDVDGVLKIKVDKRARTEDVRAMTYDLLLQVWLEDEVALKKYDQDSLHNAVRDKLFAYLDAPPATFDIEL